MSSSWPTQPPLYPPMGQEMWLPQVAAVPAPTSSGPAIAASRLIGLDVARGIAMVGMVIAHYVARDGSGSALDDVRAFMDGRAMPLFVVLGGVGISLLVRRAAHPDRQLLYRAALLLPLGLLLQEWTVGIAIILQYYAVLFVAAVALRRLSNRLLLSVAAATVAAGAFTYQFIGPRLGTYDQWTGWSSLRHPAGLLAALTLNGYYPFLPTVAFFAVGMWLGRQRLDHARWAAGLLGVGLAMAAIGYGGGRLLAAQLDADGVVTKAGQVQLRPDLEREIAAAEGLSASELRAAIRRRFPDQSLRETELEQYVESFEHSAPAFRAERLTNANGHSQMPAWMIGSTGIALAVIGGCLLAALRLPGALRPAARFGQLALSFYAFQAIVIRWTPEDETPDLAKEFLIAAGIVAVFALFGFAWRMRFRHGPLELVLRLVH